MRGSVTETQIGWLNNLAETAEALINKEIELQQQDELLTDYASQISRDFEELVWTREFAKRIQQTDIRNSIAEFMGHIYPTLIETVQAAQLILLKYPQPVSKINPFPIFADMSVKNLGQEVLNETAIEKILTRYSERGRKQPVVCNHCSSLELAGLNSFILAPIQSKVDEFGWILAVNRTDDLEFFDSGSTEEILGIQAPEFGSFEAGLMQSTASFLASHANNSALYAENETRLTSIVRELVNSIDAKVYGTCGHSVRVAKIAKKLAQEMNLSVEECDDVHLAGLLHDVGKIGLPEHIHLNQGELAAEELELLKQHPVIGFELLEQLEQMTHVLPGILHHHESLDGSGYPAGLVGDNIPLSARIIAVADAFDTMLSDRPQRKGLQLHVVNEIFTTNKGPQWDPSVIDALFATKEELLLICQGASQSDCQSNLLEIGLQAPVL
ncbi:HD domain-containing protein [Planctomicrobium sp.]|nr:HD domain-containing phosphohydrolase [Planctomicrobium sp.]MBT5019104.1 HD domain-containing protein [Planctomicrobium sp.]MDB4733045.1 HD domain-containing protein [Planctomicrobium sp.]